MMNSELFIENINLVKKIVNKMNYGYIDKDDLYQAGLIGLYKATIKIDYNKINSFHSFASIYIINEIKDELRNNKLIKLNKKIIKIKKYLNNNDLSNKSIDEIAEELLVDKEYVFIALEHYNDVCSLNEVKENEELINLIPDALIEDDYYKYYIDKLDNLLKEVIILKYYKNYSQIEISKMMKLSQSTVSRLEKKALKIIKKKIVKNVI